MKTRFLVAILLAFAATFSRAQMPVTSLWNIGSSDLGGTSTLYPLDGSANPILAQGQPFTYGPFQSTIAVTFPATSTDVTVTGVQLRETITGTGFNFPNGVTVNVPFTSPQLVPAGSKLTVTYTAPLTGLGSLAWLVVAPPPPAPPPPPPPAPPPTPTTTASKPGDCIGTDLPTGAPPCSATQLVTADGSIWTLVKGIAMKNGVPSSNQPFTFNDLYINTGGFVWGYSHDHGYQWRKESVDPKVPSIWTYAGHPPNGNYF